MQAIEVEILASTVGMLIAWAVSDAWKSRKAIAERIKQMFSRWRNA